MLTMFKSGEFISKHVTQADGSKVLDKQIQPHGVELTVDKVFKCNNYTVLGDDDYSKAPRREAHLVESGTYQDKSDDVNHRRHFLDEIDSDESQQDGYITLDTDHYVLIEGPHVIRYNEKISIPDDHVGFVFPRSRVIRSGNYLSTAVWDSGYEGRGEGGLHVNCMSFLEKGMRIGQMIMCRASVMEQYSGSHQNENLDKRQSE